MKNEELIGRVNAIQILLEALTDELITNNIINQQSLLERIESFDDEIEEIKTNLYFGPMGEA